MDNLDRKIVKYRHKIAKMVGGFETQEMAHIDQQVEQSYTYDNYAQGYKQAYFDLQNGGSTFQSGGANRDDGIQLLMVGDEVDDGSGVTVKVESIKRGDAGGFDASGTTAIALASIKMNANEEVYYFDDASGEWKQGELKADADGLSDYEMKTSGDKSKKVVPYFEEGDVVCVGKSRQIGVITSITLSAMGDEIKYLNALTGKNVKITQVNRVRKITPSPAYEGLIPHYYKDDKLTTGFFQDKTSPYNLLCIDGVQKEDDLKTASNNNEPASFFGFTYKVTDRSGIEGVLHSVDSKPIIDVLEPIISQCDDGELFYNSTQINAWFGLFGKHPTFLVLDPALCKPKTP